MAATTRTVSKTAAGKSGEKKTTPAEVKTDANGPKDFFWTYTEEPHRTRRLEIIKKHPEVRNKNTSDFAPRWVGDSRHTTNPD
ncbi:hypothetical protein NLG97_g7599 [Lecanicillium saksenae]|uniref:Uncharacterized protein n=1 Tax=Lecanicillium saksenae TaxID=468837 RepID=A0ACC1QN20_9HYPO|nr:hypothetical protein NLG97_g7599 [Lecanicillium saksenae]